MSRYRFALVGGDLRSVRLSEMLENSGNSVVSYALEGGGSGERYKRCSGMSEAVGRADIVIASVPLSTDGITLNAPLHTGEILLEEMVSAVSRGKLFISGAIPIPIRLQLEAKGVVVEDILARDDLAILNSVPTAEGAIQIAMEELPVTIQSLGILVTGYGRVGRTLASALKALGADVWVSVRRNRDAALAYAAGLHTCNYENVYDVLPKIQLLYNTVPAKVVNREMLEHLPGNCLIIDVASAPGGVDTDAATELGLRVIKALSLPGKVAPFTAAENMLAVIYNIISEKEREAIGHA